MGYLNLILKTLEVCQWPTWIIKLLPSPPIWRDSILQWLGADSKDSLHMFESQLGLIFEALCPQASYLVSLCLSFPISKWDNRTYVGRRLNVLLHAKHLEQYLAYSKSHSVPAISHLEDACGDKSFGAGVRKSGTIKQRSMTLNHLMSLRLFVPFSVLWRKLYLPFLPLRVFMKIKGDMDNKFFENSNSFINNRHY